MIFRKSILCLALFGWLVDSAQGADVFSMGGVLDPATGTWTGSASLEFVPVGNAGNDKDVTGFGKVDHDYQIGKFEVTAGQYAVFLNAVATSSDPYSLYNSSMATTQYGSKITFSGGVYTAFQPNMPVGYVSWGDAVRFCNWLQKGQPVGVEDESTTEDGAYSILRKTNSADLMKVTRNLNAKYYLPIYDEWYKAAYYDPNKNGPSAAGYWEYPTKSDSYPSSLLSSTGTNNANYDYIASTLDPPNTTEVGSFAGSLSPYGTYDQGGNVMEWHETATNSTSRGILGGSFLSGPYDLGAWDFSHDNSTPIRQVYYLGFRVATVPEPSCFVMFSFMAFAGSLIWWRKSRVEPAEERSPMFVEPRCR